MKRINCIRRLLLAHLFGVALSLPGFGEIVSNITASASSEWYWDREIFIMDRRAIHTVDFSGLTIHPAQPGVIQHVNGEESTWEAVGNEYGSEIGAPIGNDTAPWIQFNFPGSYKISSITIWNFGEPARATYRADLYAGGTFVRTLVLNTNLNYLRERPERS